MTKARASQLLRKVAGGVKHIPILSHVHLDKDGATATDLELAVRIDAATLELEITGSGCVPFAYLEKAVKAGARKVSIAGKKMHWERGSVQVLPVDDWPVIVFPPATENLPDSFMQAYAAVGCATTADDTRYSLDGVSLEPSGKMVASDGHRLHLADTFLSIKERVLIPSALMKLLPADVQRAGFAANLVSFYGEGYALQARTLEGTFPAWEKVLSGAASPNMHYDAQPLAEALKRLRSFSSGKGPVPITVALEDSNLRLTLADTETGSETWESVPVQPNGATGQHIRVGLNARYLQDAVRAVGSGDIGIPADGLKTGSPIQLQGKCGTALVMPMRV